MAGIKVSVEPTLEPLSDSEIRAYCRVQDDQDLDILRIMAKSVRQFCEEHTGRAILTQTIELFLDAKDDTEDPLWEGIRTGPYLNYYKNYINLPKGNVQSVTSVKTFNDSDVATTMSNTRYYVDTARVPSRIVLRIGETFPTALRVANAIKVEYVAGYSTVAQVPEPLRLGMLQHLAYLYDQRGDMKDYQQTVNMPPMIQKLYAPYVVHEGIGSSMLLAVG